MNNNIRMWRQDGWNMCLYFPLVAKEFATEKDIKWPAKKVLQEIISTVNVREASIFSWVAYFPLHCIAGLT